MKLFDRIATLVKADAHGVMESLEDRRLLLKQYVREAKMELQRKRARLDGLGAEVKRLTTDRQRLQTQMQALDQDITLALKGGEEDLARFAIKKLLPLREDEAAAASRLEQLRVQEAELSELLAAQERDFEALKARARTHLTTASEGLDAGDLLGRATVADEEVELELLHRRQQLGGEVA